jgi:hypothetical protein
MTCEFLYRTRAERIVYPRKCVYCSEENFSSRGPHLIHLPSLLVIVGYQVKSVCLVIKGHYVGIHERPAVLAPFPEDCESDKYFTIKYLMARNA